MKSIKSPFVTLPYLPVPGTSLISMPFTFAMCLTAGPEVTEHLSNVVLISYSSSELDEDDCAA